MDNAELTVELKRKACEIGFSLSGVCPAISPNGAARLAEWLAAGYAGEMQYLADRRDAYSDPNRVLDGVRSILMLAMNYRTEDQKPVGEGEARISRYAWGNADYHDYIQEKLNVLRELVKSRSPSAAVRGVVDTAPLLEREFAQMAGLGWMGKNTLLINRREGSWFFLAALLTDLELQYDVPHEADYCGTCRACLDACPTNAFPQPYVLDASRCISYLTIELKNSIPLALRPGVGNWLFGCDVCQEVCPWNSRSPRTEKAAFEPRNDSNPMDAIALFDLDDRAFRQRFRNTPLWRPKRRGLLRNAAIVLGNKPSAAAMPALVRGLNDSDALVRAACAWALSRHPDAEVHDALESRLTIEVDIDVRDEIVAALGSNVDACSNSRTKSTV